MPPLVAVAFTVHEPVVAGATYSPVLDPIVPQLAVQIEAALAVNCNVPLTATVGFTGLIVKVPPGAYPVSATVCGLPVAESLNMRVAERFPEVTGAKTMFAVQLAEAASVDPQVFE